MHLVASFSSCMLRLFIITVTAACFVLLWSVFALLYRKQQAMSTYQIYRWHCNAINLESCHIVCHTSFEEGSTAWCTSVLSLIHAVYAYNSILCLLFFSTEMLSPFLNILNPISLRTSSAFYTCYTNSIILSCAQHKITIYLTSSAILSNGITVRIYINDYALI